MQTIKLWEFFSDLTNEERLVKSLVQTLWQFEIIKTRPSSFDIDDDKLIVYLNDGNDQFTCQLNDLTVGIGIVDFIERINSFAE